MRKNYIDDWVNGVAPESTTVQLSARIDRKIVNNIDEICTEFGITRTNVIEAALDLGTQDLLEEIKKMNESNIKMVGRIAKEQGKEKEFNEMIKGAKDA